MKIGPYRLWVKNENYPGLAMSRSIGDLCAHSVGGTCEPGILIFINLEIFEFDINSSSRYIILASDGVWEFLSNTQVMKIIEPFYECNDVEGAIQKLIDESVKAWKTVFRSNVRRMLLLMI
jgi:serine/threonine protein phosphatase PrpC